MKKDRSGAERSARKESSMVPVLARMAVIIKADHDTNVITGNYEMAYICGLMSRFAGIPAQAFETPEAMREKTLAALSGYRPADGREKNLLRMLDAYQPEAAYDDQVRELYRMGLEEDRPWQK